MDLWDYREQYGDQEDEIKYELDKVRKRQNKGKKRNKASSRDPWSKLMNWSCGCQGREETRDFWDKWMGWSWTYGGHGHREPRPELARLLAKDRSKPITPFLQGERLCRMRAFCSQVNLPRRMRQQALTKWFPLGRDLFPVPQIEAFLNQRVIFTGTQAAVFLWASADLGHEKGGIDGLSWTSLNISTGTEAIRVGLFATFQGLCFHMLETGKWKGIQTVRDRRLSKYGIFPGWRTGSIHTQEGVIVADRDAQKAAERQWRQSWRYDLREAYPVAAETPGAVATGFKREYIFWSGIVVPWIVLDRTIKNLNQDSRITPLILDVNQWDAWEMFEGKYDGPNVKRNHQSCAKDRETLQGVLHMHLRANFLRPRAFVSFVWCAGKLGYAFPPEIKEMIFDQMLHGLC